MAKVMKFRLLRGNHRIGAQRNSDGQVTKPGRNLKPGEIIESEVDLAKIFPSRPPKFERVDENFEDEKSLEQTLRSMTKAQLIEKAEVEELDIEGLSNKQDLIEALLDQLQD